MSDLVLSKLVWMKESKSSIQRRERMRMACEMFDTAKALIVASLPRDVAADPLERDIAVLRRLYEHELGTTVIDKVIEAMRRSAAR